MDRFRLPKADGTEQPRSSWLRINYKTFDTMMKAGMITGITYYALFQAGTALIKKIFPPGNVQGQLTDRMKGSTTSNIQRVTDSDGSEMVRFSVDRSGGRQQQFAIRLGDLKKWAENARPTPVKPTHEKSVPPTWSPEDFLKQQQNQ